MIDGFLQDLVVRVATKLGNWVQALQDRMSDLPSWPDRSVLDRHTDWRQKDRRTDPVVSKGVQDVSSLFC